MNFYRFINYFFNFISKKWLVICFLIALILWLFAFGLEGYIRSKRGEAIDKHFISQLTNGIFYCLVIPYGIYLIILLMRLIIALRSYEFLLLRNLTDLTKVKEPFQINIHLKENEKTIFALNRAQLKIKDRFKFQIYLLITDRGIYIHGGVLYLKKFFSNLKHHGFDAQAGFSFFSMEDIRSVSAIDKGKKVVMTVVFKNDKSLIVFVPSADFNWNSFPRGFLKNY